VVTERRIGAVGYKFWKLFNDGWFEGEVIDVNQDFAPKCYLCIYHEDNDSEHLTMEDLIVLAHNEDEAHAACKKHLQN
jgi:hypothetical protein